MKKIEFLKSGMKYIVIVVTLILCSKSLIAQKQLKKECFEAELNSENVFTKIEILPSFIGGSNTFKCFLNSVGGGVVFLLMNYWLMIHHILIRHVFVL